MTKQIFSALRITALALILSFGIAYVYAWTAPTVTPPNGNVSAPINTSAIAQYKEGAIGIGGLIRGYANAVFDGSVGIGTTSVTPWAKLEVNGNVSLTGDDGSGHSLITSEVGGKPLMLKSRAGNYPDLVVGTSGNVGVGVTDPTQKLDVAGNIKGTGLCIGADCKTAWPASGGVTPPAGSEFLNTSATAQTKAGWLRAVGGNGGDPASRIGVGNNWWMSENTNGNYTIHRNGVGDKLTMDTSGNVGLVGGLTAASLNTGGAVTAGTVTTSGALTAAGLTTTNRLTVSEAGGAYTYITMKDDESPNGVKYIHANSNVVGFLSGYGGWLSYWDNSGNQRNIGSVTATDVCTTAGKCLSTAGSGVGVAVYLCPVHADSTYGRYRVWPGSPSACAGQLTTHSTCSSLTYGTANCAFAGHLTP